ncbi:MAG: hypothetical protein QF803_08670 [Gammaproteobacteria bacterium]|nr:hypothetical protein [Gammaproteobacteria bacterium]MDP6695673.1 hypothetical protein [Gammaproteobacteria bacterium]
MSDVFANVLYVIFAVAIGTWLLWDATFFRLASFTPYGNYWEHTAVFAEWMQNFSTPGNPHVGDPGLSSRFMPYFWVLTFIGLLFQLDPIDLMGISAVTNFVLIVFGLRRFLNDYFNDSWAPVVGFFAIFMLWGVSLTWPNLFQLRSFFYIAGYPSTFVFGLSLISFSVVIRLMRTDESLFIHTLLLMVLAALMLLCDPLTAVFGLAGCGVLALTEPADSRQRRELVIASLVLGMVLVELWPYFSAWKILLGLYGEGGEVWAGFTAFDPIGHLTSGAWKNSFYDPKLLLTVLGPSLLGLPACIWLWRRGERKFIVWGAVLMGIPCLLNLFFEVPEAHQFLLFVVVYLQLAVICGILAVIDAWQTEPRSALATPVLVTVLAIMLALTGFNIWALSLEFDNQALSPQTLKVVERKSRLPEGMNVVDVYERLTERMDYSDVVLTTAQLGWPLPTVKGKVVSLYRENPMLDDQEERYTSTVYFFHDQVADPTRSGIAKRYGATHVLTSLGDTSITSGVYDWLQQHARLSAAVGDYRMYRLMASAYVAAPAMPEPLAQEQPDATVSMPAVRESKFRVSRPVTLPMQSARSPAPDAEESDYGTPITAPIVEPITEAPQEQVSRESLEEALPEELLAPLEERTEEPDAVPAEAPPETFGAPIADPVLDPERHGG